MEFRDRVVDWIVVRIQELGLLYPDPKQTVVLLPARLRAVLTWTETDDGAVGGLCETGIAEADQRGQRQEICGFRIATNTRLAFDACPVGKSGEYLEPFFTEPVPVNLYQ